MKKILFVFIMVVFFATACNKKTDKIEVQPFNVNVQKVIDSLELVKQRIDSISNSNNGQLIHIDSYNIGKIRSIYFSVKSVQCGNETFNFINLKKDCGNEYYYSWENAILLPEECKYFISSIDVIKDNFKRTVNHEERYAYITKDDIRIVSENFGKKWDVEFSIDYHKSNSAISLSEAELDTLKTYLKKGVHKIQEL